MTLKKRQVGSRQRQVVFFMYFFYIADTRVHLIVQNVRSNLHEDLIFSFIFRKVVLKRSVTRTGRQIERNMKNMVSAVQHRTKSLNKFLFKTSTITRKRSFNGPAFENGL